MVVKKTSEVYDKICKDYERNVISEKLDHRFIEKFLVRLKPGQKILDVGAGTGRLADEMRELHLLEVISIDVSKNMKKIARKKYPQIKYLIMDMKNLKFHRSNFDALFANYSLIHVQEENVLSTLKGFARVLKPKGLLYLALQTPVKNKDVDGYYPIAYRRGGSLFINLFEEDEIMDYLKKAGFKVLEINSRKPDKKSEFPFNKLFVTAMKR